MSLKNQTVFITGASRGIGRAIALRCARDGANVVIAAKSEEPHPKLGAASTPSPPKSKSPTAHREAETAKAHRG